MLLVVQVDKYMQLLEQQGDQQPAGPAAVRRQSAKGGAAAAVDAGASGPRAGWPAAAAGLVCAYVQLLTVLRKMTAIRHPASCTAPAAADAAVLPAAGAAAAAATAALLSSCSTRPASQHDLAVSSTPASGGSCGSSGGGSGAKVAWLLGLLDSWLLESVLGE